MYQVIIDRLPALKQYVKALNKRAAKLGCEPITLTFGEVSEKKIKTEDGIKHLVRFVDVIVDGSPPQLNGWTFLGAVQFIDGATIIRAVPGVELPHKYRDTDTRCEHCHTIRHRKDVFVVQHVDGRTMQVGRQCVRDFLGHESAETVAARCQYLTSLHEALESAGDFWATKPQSWDILLVLSVTAAQMRHSNGFVSKAAAADRDKVATATFVQARICGGPNIEGTVGAILPEDEALAEKVLEWAEEIDGGTANDYLYNVRTVVLHGAVNHKTMGIAASIVSAYQRDMGRREEQKAAAATSDFFGVMKKRYSLELTVLSTRDIIGAYGITTLHIMQDADGRRFKWFASSQTLEIGKTYKLKGTVKEHVLYEGLKQTMLTRCEIVL